MQLFKICNVSLFYFVVACVFILYSVLKNENTSATVSSKVNANLTKLLFVNGIILVVYFFISILIVRYSLHDNAPLRTFFCILGFTVGFCSYLYPYYLFILFKKYVYGQNFLKGTLRKLLFLLFVLTSIIYLYIALRVTYLYYIGEFISDRYFEYLMIIPLVCVINYLCVIKDLHRFLNDLFVNSFISRKFGIGIEVLVIIGPIISFIPGWVILAPITFGLFVAFVFLVQIVAHDKAVSIDFLTGLNNRKELIRYLSRMFDKSSVLDNNIHMIFIDINDFKKINDTFGHNFGDKALLTLSKCMKKSAFDKDCFLCRYAGDEFTVVIKEKTLNTVDSFINSLMYNLEEENNFGSLPFKISLSLGVVGYSEQYKTLDEFIAAADEAMYIEKQKFK